MESNRWWFRARRDIIIDFIKMYYPQPYNQLKVIDIGCSTGQLLKRLNDEGFNSTNLYGIDVSQDAINKCHENGLKNTFVMDATNINWPDHKFDLIIASDCLEHISNDLEALRSWKKLKSPEGLMMIFVPSFMFLWSAHDETNHHYRRYTQKQLQNLGSKVNLALVNHGYWNFSLFLPVFFVHKLANIKRTFIRNKTPNGTNWNLSFSLMDRFFYHLLSLENSIIIKLRFRFPFGISTYCIFK